MPLLENSKRQERDKNRVRIERDKGETRETRRRQERD